MALAKDRNPYKSQMGLVQEDDTLDKASGFFKNFPMTHSSSFSSPKSSNSKAANYQPEGGAHSVINFKTNKGSFLSFDKNDNSTIWGDHHNIDDDDDDDDDQLHPNFSRLFQDFNCVQSSSSYGCLSNAVKENQHGGEDPFETIQEFGSFNKRPHTGESMQALKKQCTSATRKPKPKSTPSKDPQSVAAKNRRERISERLKVLQELVPNGSKVDLVTMLEKAISYVKFLQLQVKVLATDEFWPMQGGKAPDLSQVKEVIDAILSSRKDRNSSSN